MNNEDEDKRTNDIEGSREEIHAKQTKLPVRQSEPIRSAETNNEDEDNKTYKVVINHEEQYSIWPADSENALGWEDVGKVGTKKECLEHIDEVWTDMRPLSLRKQMEQSGKKSEAEGQSASNN